MVRRCLGGGQQDRQQLTENILTDTTPSWTTANLPFNSDLCRGCAGSPYNCQGSRGGGMRRHFSGHLKVKEDKEVLEAVQPILGEIHKYKCQFFISQTAA